MDRSRARRLLLAGLAIGVVGEVLLHGPALGVNVPIVVALVLALAWVMRRPGRAPDPLDAWLPMAALVFAAWVAVRADPFVVALDVLAATACTMGAAAAFSGVPLTRRAVGVVAAIGLWVTGAVVAGAGPLLRPAAPAGGPSVLRAPWLGAAGRGLFLGIPLAVIFAALFASADPIFSRGMGDLLGLRIDLGDLPGRVVVALALAWLAAGLLRVAAAGVPAMESSTLGASSLGAATRTVSMPGARTLGATEAVIVLVLVDVVVALFVGLQVAYLFGGLDTLAAIGMSYSDYARRGYFELVAAAGLAAALIAILELAILERTRAFLAGATVLVGLTLVVLASAALRLQLYQDAYGWTELRLYVVVSIVAMAAGLAALAALLLTGRMQWLAHALMAIGLVSLFALNALAPAAFVAERNLARVIDRSLVPPDGFAGLDHPYLRILPDDAVPAMVAAVPLLSDGHRQAVERVLEERRVRLATDESVRAPAAWNLAREQARWALERLPDAP